MITLVQILALEERIDQLARDLKSVDVETIAASVPRDNLGTLHVNVAVLATRASRLASVLAKKYDFVSQADLAAQAEKTLVDAIQVVAEVARDSIVAHAQPIGSREPCDVKIFSGDFAELREALQGWKDATESFLASLHK